MDRLLRRKSDEAVNQSFQMNSNTAFNERLVEIFANLSTLCATSFWTTTLRADAPLSQSLTRVILGQVNW